MLTREVQDYDYYIVVKRIEMTYLKVNVAMLVSDIGIVITLTVSIADRRRELGVLRAVGGLRAQIRGTIWLEAVAIGLIGLTLGVVTGAINLYYELQAAQHDLTAFPPAYQFPTGIALILGPA